MRGFHCQPDVLPPTVASYGGQQDTAHDFTFWAVSGARYEVTVRVGDASGTLQTACSYNDFPDSQCLD